MSQLRSFAKGLHSHKGIRIKDWLWLSMCKVVPNSVARFRLLDGSCFDYPLRSDVVRMLYWGRFENSEIAFVR